MNKTKVFKGLALMNFVCLLALFLFFRNGSFDTYFDKDQQMTSPNGGTPTKITEDTLTQNKDVKQRQRLSSSKSIVITENLTLNSDTSNRTRDSITIKSIEEEKQLMYSSKSGMIIDPKMFKIDSLEVKTKHSKKKKDK